jgi:hypothetical protein
MATTMTIFELVKIALDELYDDAVAEYGAEGVDAEIQGRVIYLSNSYGQLHSPNRQPVDYSDPATRFAYVYKYVATHGDYLVQALTRLREYNKGTPFCSTDQLRVSCIGGGPGSDIIGLVKYLSDRPDEKFGKLTCYLLDGEQAWADTWTEVGSSLPVNGSVDVNFQPLDVTKPNTWKAQKKFLKADIFTMIYFVSEVCSLDDGTVAQFFETIFDSAKSGAVFIYVDNGHPTFDNYFDLRWKKRGDIECLYECTSETHTPNYSEQKSEFGEFLTKFGHMPKLQSNLSMRILLKQ